MAVAHKGSISMGLVLIPVGLYKTTVDNDIHFNQLDKESKARIRYKKYCSHCNKEVGPDDIIKGYEYEKDKYVVMTDDDLEKIKTRKDKTIHILQFAKIAEINSIYYEKDYYAICSLYASVQAINNSPFLPQRALHGLWLLFIIQRGGSYFRFPLPRLSTKRNGLEKPFILVACPCYLRVIQNP
ncbi:Ku protein [Lachnospiraceae bacterium 47-T17]